MPCEATGRFTSSRKITQLIKVVRQAYEKILNVELCNMCAISTFQSYKCMMRY